MWQRSPNINYTCVFQVYCSSPESFWCNCCAKHTHLRVGFKPLYILWQICKKAKQWVYYLQACECSKRITEKDWVWRGLLTAVSSAPPCSEQGQLKQVAQGHVPWSFQLSPRIQTWWSALPTCFHVTPALQWKSPVSYVWIEFPVFKYVSSCSFPGYHWEAWLCLLCTLPSYNYTHWEDPSEPSLSQDEQSQLCQPLPICHSQEIRLGSHCPVRGWHCLPEGLALEAVSVLLRKV